MKFIFDIFTSPFGLPISPVYEYVILACIGIVAFYIAYYVAGKLGATSSERRIIHWFIRLVVFIALWGITKGIIELVRWIIDNPITMAI